MLKLVGQIIKYWDFLHSEAGEPSNLHTKQKLKPSGKVRDGDHEALRCSTGKRFSHAPVHSGAFEILRMSSRHRAGNVSESK